APARTMAKPGACLEMDELYALGVWAEAYGVLVSFMAGAEDRGLSLGLDDAPDLAPAARIVFRILDKDGSLRDLPELRDARTRIARIHRDISEITDSYYKDQDIRSLLQSDEPTLRD